MGTIIPIAGTVQWISGIILAVITRRRTRRFGREGRWPGAIATLAILIYALAALELALVYLGAESLIARWAPPNFTTARWQVMALLVASASAWLLLGVAAIWTAGLAVGERRRVAAAELKRRTERVRRPST